MNKNQKWTRELVLSCIKQIKANEGHIHMSYLRKNHDREYMDEPKQLANKNLLQRI